MEAPYEEIVSPGRVILPFFLTGLLIYVVRVNDNKSGLDTYNLIKTPGYFAQFDSYMVTYTNNCIEGLTVAPDNCSIYLEKIKNKFDWVTTIIYGLDAHPLYDIYVPGTVHYRKPRIGINGGYDTEIIDGVDIESLLKVSKNFMITGTGGNGKTMLEQHLILNAIANYEKYNRIPIYITLKDFDAPIHDIVECAHATIRNLWPELTMDELEAMFTDGSVIILFDGLDEIRADWARSFANAINAFLDRYTNNIVVISSRPYNSSRSFNRFTTLYLQPLTKDQALAIIDKLDFPPGDPKTKWEFREKLDKYLFDENIGFSDNPLFLTIMLMTYKKHRGKPAQMHVFYQRAISVMAMEHDNTKGIGFQREYATGWEENEFIARFSYFCAQSYFEHVSSFSHADMSKYFSGIKHFFNITDSSDVIDFIHDVCNSLCLMHCDKITGTYSFIHNSFQEYLCALFISRQGSELQYAIPIFDVKDDKTYNDNTLNMLYAMARNDVIKYMFIPYMNNLINKCSEAEGIWTFLNTIYSDLECADGDCVSTENTYPSSRLYKYISDLYSLHNGLISPSDFPCIDVIYTSTKYVGKDGVDLDTLPAFLQRRYSEVKVSGHRYRFNWERMKSDPKGKHAVEDPDGVFMKEYLALESLPSKLSEELSPLSSNPFAHFHYNN